MPLVFQMFILYPEFYEWTIVIDYFPFLLQLWTCSSAGTAQCNYTERPSSGSGDIPFVCPQIEGRKHSVGGLGIASAWWISEGWMDGRIDWCLSDRICRTDWKNEAKHKVTICARSSLLPSILLLSTSPLLQHSDNWNSQKWPWGSEKAKVLSEVSKEKCIQNNSMLRILGSTQNWTSNWSKYEVYNIDMILKIIEIRDEKVIWKLFSPPVLFNELSIFPVSGLPWWLRG